MLPPVGSGRRSSRRTSALGRDAESPAGRGRARQPLDQQRFVGRGHRDSARRPEQRALLVGDRREIAQPLGVLDVDVEHDRDVGPRDPAELGDLPRLARAALEHGRAVRGIECQQRHRHADPVVEVAGGDQRLAEERAHRGGGERLRGGLAGGAADGEHRQRAARRLAVDEGAGEVAERDQGVVGLDART